MTKEEYVEMFRYKLRLLSGDPTFIQDYQSYREGVDLIRRLMAKILRRAELPAWLRIEYNQALTAVIPDHKRFLWSIDPTCKLCTHAIVDFKDATIDHIIPKSIGGSNGIKNQQLAHAKCNSLKGCKPIRTLAEMETTK